MVCGTLVTLQRVSLRYGDYFLEPSTELELQKVAEEHGRERLEKRACYWFIMRKKEFRAVLLNPAGSERPFNRHSFFPSSFSFNFFHTFLLQRSYQNVDTNREFICNSSVQSQPDISMQIVHVLSPVSVCVREWCVACDGLLTYSGVVLLLLQSFLQINTNTAFMHLGINWQLCVANMVGNTPSYTSSMRVLLCTSLCYHKRIHEHPTQQKQWSPGNHTAIDLNVMDKPLNKLGQVCCIGDWQNFQFQWSIFWNQVSFSVQLAQSTHRANRAADGQQRGCNRGQPCGSTTRSTCCPPGWGREGAFISSKHCEVPVTPQC